MDKFRGSVWTNPLLNNHKQYGTITLSGYANIQCRSIEQHLIENISQTIEVMGAPQIKNLLGGKQKRGGTKIFKSCGGRKWERKWENFKNLVGNTMKNIIINIFKELLPIWSNCFWCFGSAYYFTQNFTHFVYIYIYYFFSTGQNKMK